MSPETLEDKTKRLVDAHNQAYDQFLHFQARTKLLLDSLMAVLDTEIPDFEIKFKAENLRLRIEATLEARVLAYINGDLNAFAAFGRNLEALKHEAKEIGEQSLYNKTMRRTIVSLESKFKDRLQNGNLPIEQIISMPNIDKR